MSSGIKVSQACCSIIADLQQNKTIGKVDKKSKRAVVFKINKKCTEIEPIEDRSCTFEEDLVPFMDDVAADPSPCYVLADVVVDQDHTEPIIIKWCPDSAKIKEKMLVASSWSAVLSKADKCLKLEADSKEKLSLQNLYEVIAKKRGNTKINYIENCRVDAKGHVEAEESKN